MIAFGIVLIIVGVLSLIIQWVAFLQLLNIYNNALSDLLAQLGEKE